MVIMDIQKYKQILNQKIGIVSQLKSDQNKANNQIEILEEKINNIEKAQLIIQNVAKQTLKELECQLSNIVSPALAAIFDDPYKLSVSFIINRGKTECNLLFEQNGKLFNPFFDSGGGVIDVAAIALRIAIWRLIIPSPRNVLILDEPFQHLKGEEANKKAIQMIKTISKQMGIQIIMVSDERAAIQDIQDGADKVFYVSLENRVSKIQEIIKNDENL